MNNTATAILILIEKQLLHFEDKITNIIDLNRTAIPKDVSIYNLLTHTSGIADDADEEAGENYSDLYINNLCLRLVLMSDIIIVHLFYWD